MFGCRGRPGEEGGGVVEAAVGMCDGAEGPVGMDEGPGVPDWRQELSRFVCILAGAGRVAEHDRGV